MTIPSRPTQSDSTSQAPSTARPVLPEPGQAGENPSESQPMSPESRRVMVIVIVAVILVVALLVTGVTSLALAPAATTAHIRDISIIFMAFASMVSLLALVLLLVQLARLINLLQNEIGPILASLNVTISNLRGTSLFLSDNLTEPVIKLNEYLAGLSQLFYVLGLTRKPPKSNSSKGE